LNNAFGLKTPANSAALRVFFETTMPTPERKSDCYSESERASIELYQGFKQRLLRPLLVVLSGMGITPNQVTFVSAVAGAAFCPLYLWSDQAWAMPAAIFLLAMHMIIDGIDGPLARHDGSASPSGSFTDSMGDQIVIAATTIALMVERAWELGSGANLVAGGIYIFLYTVVVGFAMVRNSLEIPYRFVVRPRNGIYAWIFIDFCFLNGDFGMIADAIFWVCNAILLIHFVDGFLAIKRRI